MPRGYVGGGSAPSVAEGGGGCDGRRGGFPVLCLCVWGTFLLCSRKRLPRGGAPTAPPPLATFVWGLSWASDRERKERGRVRARASVLGVRGTGMCSCTPRPTTRPGPTPPAHFHEPFFSLERAVAAAAAASRCQWTLILSPLPPPGVLLPPPGGREQQQPCAAERRTSPAASR